MFEEEAAKPENPKVEGQTVRAGMEGIIKDNGIDFGAFWAGDIQGNGCWKLMSCGGDITKSMMEFLQIMPAFVNLGEDAGERAHKEEARNKSRVGAVVNLEKKERTKSQFEAMKKSAKVKEMMIDLEKESKRKFTVDVPSQAQENGTERKRLREEQRDELLLRPLLDGTRILLSDIKIRKTLND